MARSRGKVIKLFSARRRSGIRAPWDQMILLVQTLDTVHYIWTLPDISAPREFRARLTPRAPRETLPAAGPIKQAPHPCSRRLQAHGLAAGALRGLVSFVCVKGPYQATGPSHRLFGPTPPPIQATRWAGSAIAVRLRRDGDAAVRRGLGRGSVPCALRGVAHNFAFPSTHKRRTALSI